MIEPTSSDPAPRPDQVKVTLNLPVETVESLTALARARGVSRTQAIRDALHLQAYVASVQDGGGKLVVRRGGDRRLYEVLFH